MTGIRTDGLDSFGQSQGSNQGILVEGAIMHSCDQITTAIVIDRRSDDKVLWILGSGRQLEAGDFAGQAIF